MTPPKNPWRIVAAREATAKLTDKNFLVSTILTLFLLASIFGVQAFLGTRVSTRTVAVIDAAGRQIVDTTAARVIAADSTRKLVALPVADRAGGEQALQEGRADALLTRSVDPADGWQLLTLREPQQTLQDELGRTVRESAVAANAAAVGTSLAALLRGSTLTGSAIDQQAADSFGVARVLGLAYAVLFYVAALLFGMQIAQSVVEEKQSRIVEILATAIPLRQLLIGKVTGNTACAFGQMFLYAAVGLVGIALTEQAITMPVLLSSMGWFLAFFVTGFVALACVWAVAGALASRSEDLQSTSMPVTVVLIVAFFAGMTLDGTARSISSYVPIVSGITMPGRIAVGEVSWFEPLIALALTLVLAALTIRFGERVYRRSLLQSRGRVSLRRVWSARDEVADAMVTGA